MAKALGSTTPDRCLAYALTWEKLRLPILEHRATYWPEEWDSDACKCRALINIYSDRIEAMEAK